MRFICYFGSNGGMIERGRWKKGLYSKVSKTIYVNQDNYQIRKRYKSYINRFSQYDFQLNEGLNDDILNSFDYLIFQKLAPAKNRIIKISKSYNMKWYSIEMENVVLASVGLIEAGDFCRFKYISSAKSKISKEASLFLFDFIINKYISKNITVDLGGVSDELNNGIDQFKLGFQGDLGFCYENYNILVVPFFYVKNFFNKKITAIRYKGRNNYIASVPTTYWKILLTGTIIKYILGGKVVYDIGSGTGRMLHFLNNRFNIETLGFEINPFVLAYEDIFESVEVMDVTTSEINVTSDHKSINLVLYFYNSLTPQQLDQFLNVQTKLLSAVKYVVLNGKVDLTKFYERDFILVFKFRDVVVLKSHFKNFSDQINLA